MPYKNLYDIVEPLMTAGWDKNVGHLYSTGRCGSTLLSKVLDQVCTHTPEQAPLYGLWAPRAPSYPSCGCPVVLQRAQFVCVCVCVCVCVRVVTGVC